VLVAARLATEPGIFPRKLPNLSLRDTSLPMRDLDPRSPYAPRPRRRDKQPGKRSAHRPPWHVARDRGGRVILYGWHSVKAAIENPARKFHRLLATENALRRLAEERLTLPVEPAVVRPEAIAALVGPEAVHQGLLVEADPLPSLAIEDIVPDGVLLVFDQITDPHNVGAILRTAAAFAVTAVITTARHSPEATGVLAKAASGALECVPIVTVPNIARALEALKDKNVLVVGLDSASDITLAAVPLRDPVALVLGAEGKGLRQLTRTTCDYVARIEFPGRIKSLNVSNAAALALYVASTRIGRVT
jgi:23S rRNA (guanosine2251-2'-O)-methyltransferase